MAPSVSQDAKEFNREMLYRIIAQAVRLDEDLSKEIVEDIAPQIGAKKHSEAAAEAGKPRWDWEAPAEDTSLTDAVAKQSTDALTAAYQISDKQERQDAVAAAKNAAVEALVSDEDGGWSADDVAAALKSLEKKIVRQRVIKGEPRIDGRDTSTVRPITIRTGVLPRAHGSAIFTRGETQAIVTTTLGTGRDAQIDTAQHRYRAGATGEGLVQAAAAEHRFTHSAKPPPAAPGRHGVPGQAS